MVRGTTGLRLVRLLAPPPPPLGRRQNMSLVETRAHLLRLGVFAEAEK